ncbi:12485_t:CDS:2 [Cetraspora pellucida]|uniref:12485_t:CDS:1 n=1 Tax=Cetraspora pellucida TaxID=1433469 RepID=A0A9N9DPQ3_9GLOM|nr:12485_t:CDS:2 [Cetraspora pellucida]
MFLTSLSTGCFESHEALIQHAQFHALNHGYAVCIKRLERDKFVYLCCDRGGVYRNSLNLTDETCQRAMSSRLIDCPFELYRKKKNEQWHLTIKNPIYNHKLSEDMSGHLSHRRLNLKEQQRVHQISDAGIHPREMLSTFRQDNPNLMAISKTIYNARDKIRCDNLKGRMPIQALLDELKEENMIINALVHIAHIFIDISKPQHIEKNVLSNCHHYLPIEDELREFLRSWSILINSKSEEEFNEKWEELVRKYNEKPSITKYLQDVEGSYAMLKKYLQVSTRDLHAVHERIVLALKNQYQEIKTQISQDATSENSLQPCTGTFTSSMGLPCSYIIQEHLNNNQYLQLNDFHKHWWLQRHQLFLSIPTGPAYQQTTALNEMSSLFQETAITMQDPQEQHIRGCLVGARNAQSSI